MCKVFVLLVQTYCFFASKQCVIKQLLDSVFVISGIIKVSVVLSVRPFGSADNTFFYLDLDYSGYHKNPIQYLFVVNIIIMPLIIIISYYYY